MTAANDKSVLQAIIIGSGFGGLCQAIALKKSGIENFVILEKEGSVGGTWRDNSYPGAACDVESHLYSFSFEPNSNWSRKYATQQEILAYLNHCVDKYVLAEHIQLNSEVESAAFNSVAGTWTVKTLDGVERTAVHLVTACGQLNRPAIPDINGAGDYQGSVFHSARWDHDCDLSGKSVAVIGTGASAIQFVPQIAAAVNSLELFQRSGAWVLPKKDRRFRAFEKSLFGRFPIFQKLYRSLIYWQNEGRAVAFSKMQFLLPLYALRSRFFLSRKVNNAQKRKQLQPDYKIGCKRVLISNDWFHAVNREQVRIVTTQIERIVKDGIVTRDGQHHPVDAIIYGTGFAATEFLAPMKITGLKGLDLNVAWRNGAEAHLGICVSGFPNLFMLYGPNTNLGHNSVIHMIESQVRYIMRCIQLVNSEQWLYLNVKPQRQQQFVGRIQRQLADSVWASGCRSWYTNAAGRNTNNWPGFTFTYRRLTNTVNLSDFDLKPDQSQ